MAPRWKELFYVSADQKLTSVPVKLGATVAIGSTDALFPVFPVPGVQFATSFYAPTGDGQRFLVNSPAVGEASAARRIIVVTNWQAALKK